MAAKKAVEKKSHSVSLADEDAVREILAGTVLDLWEGQMRITP